MPTRDDIVLFASYNAAMNARLYAAAAALPQDALKADRGAFFGSILGTLKFARRQPEAVWQLAAAFL